MYKLFLLLPFLVLLTSCADSGQKPSGTSLFLLVFACIPIFFLVWMIFKYNRSVEEVVYTEEDLEALKYLDLVKKSQEQAAGEVMEGNIDGVEVIKKLVKEDLAENKTKTNRFSSKMSFFSSSRKRKTSKANEVMKKKRANAEVKMMTIKKEMEIIEKEDVDRKPSILAKIRNFSNKNKANKA